MSFCVHSLKESKSRNHLVQNSMMRVEHKPKLATISVAGISVETRTRTQTCLNSQSLASQSLRLSLAAKAAVASDSSCSVCLSLLPCHSTCPRRWQHQSQWRVGDGIDAVGCDGPVESAIQGQCCWLGPSFSCWALSSPTYHAHVGFTHCLLLVEVSLP